jgi:hypothetical protein
VVAAAAPEAGKTLAGYVRGPAVACCGFGVLCATGVMLYAISMRWKSSACCLFRLLNAFFEHFGYVTLYILLDLFVLFSFFFFFVVLLLCVIDAGLVASCAAVTSHGPITGPACIEIRQALEPAVLLAAVGGTLNFLLSYHMLAALQATYSQYVVADSEKIVKAAIKDAHEKKKAHGKDDTLQDTMVESKGKAKTRTVL